ncbi:hypothetical protein TCAL_16619 [Tigriopus californicus]|uniref:Uncharacterized protein n=1 Tax=Tigriopus californicus TaxID=6832 RepID=A0A553NAS1_TIGCA|nr:hypothetical protein TCAL_16619 [Tigriopus californicus]
MKATARGNWIKLHSSFATTRISFPLQWCSKAKAEYELGYWGLDMPCGKERPQSALDVMVTSSKDTLGHAQQQGEKPNSHNSSITSAVTMDQPTGKAEDGAKVGKQNDQSWLRKNLIGRTPSLPNSLGKKKQTFLKTASCAFWFTDIVYDTSQTRDLISSYYKAGYLIFIVFSLSFLGMFSLMVHDFMMYK